MAYNKFFFNLNKLNAKEGSSLFKSNDNTNLTLTNNLFFEDDFTGFITSSDSKLYITGNLHLNNKLTSSNLKTDRISFDSDNTISIFSDLDNKLEFNNRCELSGSATLKDKLISTGITGSLTEIASGKNLIIGENGISVNKVVDASTGLQFFEITAGDSAEEVISPINTIIYVKVVGGTPDVTQSGIRTNDFNNIINDFLITNNNHHTLKVHKYYNTIFLGERLIFVINLKEANANSTVDLDFRSDVPGETNRFRRGNDIKCSFFFSDNSNTQKVRYIFDSFDGINKNKYEFIHLNNNRSFEADNTAEVINNQLIVSRNNTFAGSTDSFSFIGNKVNQIVDDTTVSFHNNHYYFHIL